MILPFGQCHADPDAAVDENVEVHVQVFDRPTGEMIASSKTVIAEVFGVQVLRVIDDALAAM